MYQHRKIDNKTRHVYVCVGVLYTGAENTHIHPPKNTHTKQSFCLQLEEWQCWWFWTDVENSPQHQNPEEQWQESTLLQDLHPVHPWPKKERHVEGSWSYVVFWDCQQERKACKNMAAFQGDSCDQSKCFKIISSAGISCFWFLPSPCRLWRWASVWSVLQFTARSWKDRLSHSLSRWSQQEPPSLVLSCFWPRFWV